MKIWRGPSGILQEVQGSRECFDGAGSERVHIGILVLLGCNREVERGEGVAVAKKKKTAPQEDSEKSTSTTNENRRMGQTPRREDSLIESWGMERRMTITTAKD